LSDPKHQPNDSLEPELSVDRTGGVVGLLVRVLRFFGKLRAWATGHWLRGVIVAGTILVLIASTMAGWAYLASVALRSGELSLDVALRDLDEGRFEAARAIVGRRLKSGRLPRSDFGGPLYVLGAIKTYDAENQATAEKRRTEFLVASRYLNEANAYGFPPGREIHGLFLLGKSLVESSQFDEGLRRLDDLLNSRLTGDEPLAWETHRLLSNTCLLMPYPSPEKALAHTEALLKKPELSGTERTEALLQQAECLTRLERFDEARQAAQAAADGKNRQDDVELILGRIALDEINATLQRVATQDRQAVIRQSTAKVAEAMQYLQQAASKDNQKGRITRQTSYHLGRALELQGQTDNAIRQFAKTRQLYRDSFEGLAAALAEADLLRGNGDFEGAIAGYRRVLESFISAADYRSVVMPLPQVRERLMAALKDFVTRQRYADALVLLEHYYPLFSRTEQLELRGDTLERWGNELLADQASENTSTADADRSAGLRHLRAAGWAFEQLSQLRYATRFYTTDLWHSAENYFRGHSFSRTVQVLNEYLDNEPELRNAQALLRLGQAHLALGQIPQSIAAFEECIEFRPQDSSTSQARIDCAIAYWSDGNTSRAEQLLRENIASPLLRPESKEWKDSNFELGVLLHEMGRHEEAIGILEDAMERYPQAAQRLLAQYIVGQSYRQWAEALSLNAQQARTTTERDKNQKAAVDRFNSALIHFEDVQRTITLKTHDIHSDPLLGSMLRNCYMLEGTVLFELGNYDLDKYKEAIEAFSNVASLYPDEPFVLETFVQIANCWRRLDENEKARGSIAQAQIALNRLPAEADFATTTGFNRDEWQMLLADMSRW
jgi:tetratricopeptide (TPR) repeat protein